jgi:hypothetical protein
MLHKHHSLEAYYLHRRLELLNILDEFANETFHDEDSVMDDDHWKLQILKNEYSDVIDPDHLCSALRNIYPEHLFKIESNKS